MTFPGNGDFPVVWGVLATLFSLIVVSSACVSLNIRALLRTGIQDPMGSDDSQNKNAMTGDSSFIDQSSLAKYVLRGGKYAYR